MTIVPLLALGFFAEEIKGFEHQIAATEFS